MALEAPSEFGDTPGKGLGATWAMPFPLPIQCGNHQIFD